VDDEPVVLLGGSGSQTDPAVSLDGRWIAYASDETSTPQVYVSPFPDAHGGKWLVSSNSGWGPKWSRSGRVLFFDGVGLGQPLVSVEVIEAGAAFDNRPPSVFSAEPWYGSGRTQNVYEVTVDDDRLLVGIDPIRSTTGGAGDAPVNQAPVLVNSFFEELRRLLPAGRCRDPIARAILSPGPPRVGRQLAERGWVNPAPPLLTPSAIIGPTRSMRVIALGPRRPRSGAGPVGPRGARPHDRRPQASQRLATGSACGLLV